MYYVEFSIIQNCFHIDTMERIQKANLSLCERHINNGYVIIGGPFTNGEAKRFITKMHGLKEQGDIGK